MAGRRKRTAKEYIDKMVGSRAASKTGVVRRARSGIPAHLSLADLIADVTSRGYKFLIGDAQIIIITDRKLLICN